MSTTIDSTSYDYLLMEMVKYCARHKTDNNKIKREQKIGQQIGYKLANRLMDDPTKQFYQNSQDVIQFIKHKIWPTIFNKKLHKIVYDNKKHRYKLIDDNFYFFSNEFYKSFTQTYTDNQAGKDIMKTYLALFSAIIVGVLDNTDYKVKVNADLRYPPRCVFSITFIN